MAEGEGFEPPVRLRTPVFKTGAFNRSAIPPRVKWPCLILKTIGFGKQKILQPL